MVIRRVPNNEIKYIDNHFFLFDEANQEFIKLEDIPELDSFDLETPAEVIAINHYLPVGQKLVEVDINPKNILLIQKHILGDGLAFGSGCVYYDIDYNVIAFVTNVMDNETFYMREDLVIA